MPIDKSQYLSAPGLTGIRPIGTAEARALRSAGGARDAAAAPAAAQASQTGATTFQPSEALDPGAAPVDGERVAVIRKAIETGSYPVIPTRIADAMIAAGLLLRAQA